MKNDDKPLLDIGKWTQLTTDLLQLVQEVHTDMSWSAKDNSFIWNDDDILQEIDKILNDNFEKVKVPTTAKVFLDFKWDSFVSVETTLTPEEAANMTEEGMDALRAKYQMNAVKLYENRIRRGDFAWELDFHVQEADGSETEIKI